jgi:hypothetical protein
VFTSEVNFQLHRKNCGSTALNVHDRTGTLGEQMESWKDGLSAVLQSQQEEQAPETSAADDLEKELVKYIKMQPAPMVSRRQCSMAGACRACTQFTWLTQLQMYLGRTDKKLRQQVFDLLNASTNHYLSGAPTQVCGAAQLFGDEDNIYDEYVTLPPTPLHPACSSQPVNRHSYACVVAKYWVRYLASTVAQMLHGVSDKVSTQVLPVAETFHAAGCWRLGWAMGWTDSCWKVWDLTRRQGWWLLGLRSTFMCSA